VAKVTIQNGELRISLSLIDRALTFESSFRIPLSHITNAYVSNIGDLELQDERSGQAFNLQGHLKIAGIYHDRSGLIFCDIGGSDCLVIETRGERFPRIAIEVQEGADPNQLAHEIVAALPDEGTSSAS
jgi:hypothetical protein